jgi:hypothetical protein
MDWKINQLKHPKDHHQETFMKISHPVILHLSSLDPKAIKFENLNERECKGERAAAAQEGERAAAARQTRDGKVKHVLCQTIRIVFAQCKVVWPGHSVRPKIRLMASGTDLITILRCFLSF